MAKPFKLCAFFPGGQADGSVGADVREDQALSLKVLSDNHLST